MKLKKISLNNIRSYENQEISFPDGSVLLSGDIGSGKSTILLALEFALFGLQTGYLSGASLLRNGTDKGSVEVELELDNKKITIKRSLKRSKKSVIQEKGFFAVNDVSEELGAEELKQRVLDMLGYPLSLVKARTNMLYRFTVYTPQEEMRQILLESVDQRIDTIRKIFSIDKYKKIAENIELVAAHLREEARFKENQVSDVPSLLEQKKEREQEVKDETAKNQVILSLYASVKASLEETEKESEKILSQMSRLNELKQQLTGLNSELKVKEYNLNEIKEQLSDSEKEIKELEIKLRPSGMVKEVEDISEILKQKTQGLKDVFESYTDVLTKIKTLELKKSEIISIKSKIESMNECPMCKQKVTAEHKCKIAEQNTKILNEIELNVQELKVKAEEFSKKKSEIENELDGLREKEKNQEKIKIMSEAFKEKKNFLEKLRQKEKETAGNILALKNEKDKIGQELDSFKNIDSLAAEIKQKLESLRKKEREIEIEKVKHERNIENIKNILESINAELRKRERITIEMNRLKRLNEWLLKHYMEIILTIEKTVMTKLNYEFNVLFEKWFKMLVDNFDARIDENFTPIIEQQGYEISYDALSGGERTAAALAYRLALNQIITHFMGKLKTKGLLILDEPTDGFSSEQMDKMKNIVRELNFEQLILVSHESEIEDFVENVISFEKKDGLTKIAEQIGQEMQSINRQNIQTKNI